MSIYSNYTGKIGESFETKYIEFKYVNYFKKKAWKI